MIDTENIEEFEKRPAYFKLVEATDKPLVDEDDQTRLAQYPTKTFGDLGTGNLYLHKDKVNRPQTNVFAINNSGEISILSPDEAERLDLMDFELIIHTPRKVEGVARIFISLNQTEDSLEGNLANREFGTDGKNNALNTTWSWGTVQNEERISNSTQFMVPNNPEVLSKLGVRFEIQGGEAQK